jgi:hypothetical protein
MSKKYDVAFYRNRGKFSVDRTIEFEPKYATDYVPLEEMLQDTGFTLDQYRLLCRKAVGLTTRILFLPPETVHLRALRSDSVDTFKPSGGYVEFEGENFKGSLSMDNVDFQEHGLRSMGTKNESYDIHGHASVDGHIFLNDVFHSVSFGKNGALVFGGLTGELFPTQNATPEYINEWTENILIPIEFDIKSRAYVWTGDRKTNLSIPERIV